MPSLRGFKESGPRPTVWPSIPEGHHGGQPATIIIGSSQYSVSTRGKVTHDFISPPLSRPIRQ